MVQTIVINQSNIVSDGQNNKLVYSFPNSVSFPNHEIAIQSVYMYYSWVNINGTTLNNNTFSFFWPTNEYIVPADIDNQIKVVIPDGLYEISTLNQYLQWFCIKNGYYLISAATNANVYFMEFVVNPTEYAVQFNAYPVPTAAEAAGVYIAPVANPILGTADFAGYADGVATCPQLYIPNNNNFYKIFGFPNSIGNNPNNFFVIPNAVSFGDNLGANYSFLSTTSPQVQPNPVVFLALSNIENNYATPSSIIGVVSPQVGFGELIQSEPPQFAWNKLLPGTYNSLRLSFIGTDKSQITILDPQMTITLVIRDKKDISIGDALASATAGK
jgi:hypothetical protein